MDLSQIKYYIDLFDWNAIKEKNIYLAGSSRFKEMFGAIEVILQVYFEKLISVSSWYGLDHKEQFSDEEWEVLQQICFQKIANSDAMLVINFDPTNENMAKNLYVGAHTKEELERASIPIYYLSELLIK